jgi:hypothetical protein
MLSHRVTRWEMSSGQGIPISELFICEDWPSDLSCRRVQRTTEVLNKRISQADHNALNVLLENILGAALVDASRVALQSISFKRRALAIDPNHERSKDALKRLGAAP